MTGRFEKADWQIVSGLFVVLFATKFAMLSLPLYWDEIYVGEMAYFALEGGFNPVRVLRDFEDVGHPPGFAWLIAAGWSLLEGYPAWWPHLLALVWAGLGLAGTYGIGRALGGRPVGGMAAFLLLADPHWWSLSVQAHLDNAVFGGAILLIYLAFIDRWLLFAIAGTLVALSKIYAVQTLPAAGLIWLVRALRRRHVGPWPHLAGLLFPALSFAGWVLFHHRVTGWGLFRPTDAPDRVWNLAELAGLMGRNAEQVFFSQGRVLLTVAAILGALALAKWPRPDRPRPDRPRPSSDIPPGDTGAVPDETPADDVRLLHAALALTAAIFIGLVAWGLQSKGFSYQRRYMLPVYPAVYIWGSLALWRLLDQRAWIAAGLVAVVSIALWWAPDGPPQGESSLEYLNALAVRQACYDFLVELDPEPGRILTSVYPNSKEWGVPYTGYGPPLGTLGADYLHAVDWLRLDLDVLVQLEVPGAPLRYIPDLARAMRFPLLREFRSGNWTARVYGRVEGSRTESDFGYFGDAPLSAEWRYLGRYNTLQLDVWAAALPEPVVDVRLQDSSKPAQMKWTRDGEEVPFDADLDTGFAHYLAWSLKEDQLLVGLPVDHGPPSGEWRGDYRTLR